MVSNPVSTNDFSVHTLCIRSSQQTCTVGVRVSFHLQVRSAEESRRYMKDDNDDKTRKAFEEMYRSLFGHSSNVAPPSPSCNVELVEKVWSAFSLTQCMWYTSYVRSTGVGGANGHVLNRVRDWQPAPESDGSDDEEEEGKEKNNNEEASDSSSFECRLCHKNVSKVLRFGYFRRFAILAGSYYKWIY